MMYFDEELYEAENYTEEEFEALSRQTWNNIVSGNLACAVCGGRTEVFNRGFTWAHVDGKTQAVCMPCVAAYMEDRRGKFHR